MKILFIAPKFNGAASRAVLEYQIALAKAGLNDVHVLLQFGNKFEIDGTHKKNLMQLLDKIKPDIIHVIDNELIKYEGPLSIYRERAPRLKIVFSYLLLSTEVDRYYALHGQDTEHFCSIVLQKKQTLSLLFADYIHVVNANQFRILTNDYSILENKIVKIFRTGDVNPLRQDTDGEYILSVGRICPQKNYLNLIKSMQYIPSENLKIVGQIIDESYYNSMIEVIATLQLHNRVEIISYNKNNPDWYYTRAKLFVLCSYFETFGQVLVDASRYDLPLVCTDCGTFASNDVFAGDYRELAKIINDALLHPDLYKNYSFIRDNCNYIKIGNELKDFYLKICS